MHIRDEYKRTGNVHARVARHFRAAKAHPDYNDRDRDRQPGTVVVCHVLQFAYILFHSY